MTDYLFKGTILKGKYVIEDKIENSDFSNIYLGTYKNTEVVIKECFPRSLVIRGSDHEVFTVKYKDKFEMIDSYQKELFHKLEYIFDKYEGKKEGAFLEIFEILTREKLLSALLSTNGAKEIQDFLINKLQRMIAKDFIDPTAEKRALKGFEKDYASIYFAHAIFGACQAWINKGKKESPQEMTDFLLRFIPQ